jgi:hypothetical protein
LGRDRRGIDRIHWLRPYLFSLARPIGTDQFEFFAGIQLKRSIHEEQLLALLLIDV